MAFTRVAALLHAALSDVAATDHHTATVAGDLNLADLAARAHADLSDAPADAHQVRSHDHSVAGDGQTLSPVTINVGTGNIVFPAAQNADAGATVLDDYEEGAFTPTILFGGNQVGNVYGSQLGRYVKIGRIVHIYGEVALTTKGSSSGSARIGGLPFTAANNGVGVRTGGANAIVNVSFANQMLSQVLNNEALIRLTEVTEAGAQTDLTEGNFGNSSFIHTAHTYEV